MEFLINENSIRYFMVPLEENGRVKCWFSTRSGDKKPYNPDEEGFDGPFLAVLSKNGVDITRMVSLKQVHGDGVIIVRDDMLSGQNEGEIGIGDALVSCLGRTPLVIKVADCLSIQLWDPSSGAIANIHCGWRSGAKNIITITISKMIKLYGFKPDTAKIVLMPSISRENYQVGNDVYKAYIDNIEGMEKFFERKRDESWLFDLRGMALDQLKRTGIRNENIFNIDLCTYKNSDLFHSFRREGKSTGRMLAVIEKNN
jgi:YfiH family protein